MGVKQKRTALLVIVTSFFCYGTVIRGDEVQLRASGIYYLPQGSAVTANGSAAFIRDVEWDEGSGVEVQIIFWRESSKWGVGGILGVATWDIEDYLDLHFNEDFLFGDTLEGDVDMTILGASLFRRMFSEHGTNKKLSGALEIGIRLVSIDSNIKGVTGITDGRDALLWTQTLEIDDSIIGLLAISLEYATSESVDLFAQIGVQRDLDQGDVEDVVPGLGTFDSGETELEAIFGKVGVSIAL